jgi:hypothetical protein
MVVVSVVVVTGVVFLSGFADDPVPDLPPLGRLELDARGGATRPAPVPGVVSRSRPRAAKDARRPGPRARRRRQDRRVPRREAVLIAREHSDAFRPMPERQGVTLDGIMTAGTVRAQRSGPLRCARAQSDAASCTDQTPASHLTGKTIKPRPSRTPLTSPVRAIPRGAGAPRRGSCRCRGRGRPRSRRGTGRRSWSSRR